MEKGTSYYPKLYEYITSLKNGDNVMYIDEVYEVVKFDSEKRLMHIFKDGETIKTSPNKLTPAFN
jgi:hypothetical protein